MLNMLLDVADRDANLTCIDCSQRFNMLWFLWGRQDSLKIFWIHPLCSWFHNHNPMIVHAYDFFTRLDVSWKRRSYWRPAFFLVFWVFFWMCFLYDLFQSNECRKAKKNVVAQKKHSLFADFTLLYHLEGMFATCCNHTLEEMFIIGFNICSIWFKSGFGVSSACRVRTQPVTLDDTSTVCTVDEPSQDGFLHSRLVQYLPTFTPKELPSLGNFGIYYINFHIMSICILYIHHQTKYILPLLVYNIYIYMCNVYCMCMYVYIYIFIHTHLYGMGHTTCYAVFIFGSLPNGTRVTRCCVMWWTSTSFRRRRQGWENGDTWGYSGI